MNCKKEYLSKNMHHSYGAYRQKCVFAQLCDWWIQVVRHFKTPQSTINHELNLCI